MSYPMYEEMRDLGVEWLGATPASWYKERLKFSVRLVNDKLEALPDGLPYIGLENIQSQTGRILWIDEPQNIEGNCSPFQRRDVLFGKLRPYLAKVANVNIEGACSTEILVLRPIKPDSKFLTYYLLSDNIIQTVDASTYGAKMPRASWDFIGNLPQLIPPLAEQQRIATFLDAKTAEIDELIALRERQVALLQQKRVVLISRAVTKGIDPHTPMRESGIAWLGEVPEGWEVRRLKHISPMLTVGVVVNPSSYVIDEGVVPFLLGSNIGENQFYLENVRRISEASNQELQKSILRAGDLVTVRVGEPGVTAVVPQALDGANCASVMIVRRSKNFVSQWLCYAMNSIIGKIQVEMVRYGAAQKQFNISHAIDFAFPVPL